MVVDRPLTPCAALATHDLTTHSYLAGQILYYLIIIHLLFHSLFIYYVLITACFLFKVFAYFFITLS